jgi:hypothetical protein
MREIGRLKRLCCLVTAISKYLYVLKNPSELAVATRSGCGEVLFLYIILYIEKKVYTPITVFEFGLK